MGSVSGGAGGGEVDGVREAARFLVGVTSVVCTWLRPLSLLTCGLVLGEASGRCLRFLGVAFGTSPDGRGCCAQGSLRVIAMSFPQD